MQSTVGANKSGVKTKTNQPSQDLTNVREIEKITRELLPSFPFLAVAPDVMYWLMVTWGLESGWKLFHGKAPGVVSSRHLTPSPPKYESTLGQGPKGPTGTLIGNGYQYSNVIQNLWNSPVVTPQIKFNIKDGWYAHGVTACMGTYHVRGCPNNLGEWRSRPEAVAVISALGLEVDPGQSISGTLFAVDNYESRRRSVAAGMIIFNAKYRQGLSMNGGNTAAAMSYAIGAYLGAAGARDANGVSPDDRRRQASGGSGAISILQAIGIVRSGQRTTLTAEQLSDINLQDKSGKDRGGNVVVNNPAGAATTNGASNGQTGKISGCEV